jgi:hypothetical protein
MCCWSRPLHISWVWSSDGMMICGENRKSCSSANLSTTNFTWSYRDWTWVFAVLQHLATWYNPIQLLVVAFPFRCRPHGYVIMTVQSLVYENEVQLRWIMLVLREERLYMGHSTPWWISSLAHNAGWRYSASHNKSGSIHLSFAREQWHRASAISRIGLLQNSLSIIYLRPLTVVSFALFVRCWLLMLSTCTFYSSPVFFVLYYVKNKEWIWPYIIFTCCMCAVATFDSKVACSQTESWSWWVTGVWESGCNPGIPLVSTVYVSSLCS